MGDAIFKQKSGILGVGIAAPCGIITPEQLIGLGTLSKKVKSLGSKLTTRQTIIFLIKEEKLKDFQAGVQELGLRIGSFGEVIRNVKSCAGGEQFCLRSLTDVFKLATELQEIYMDQKVPHDFKISVAGCQRGCTDPLCADYGIIATGPDTYSIYLGGRGGSRQPEHGTLLCSEVNVQGVKAVLDFVLDKYRSLGQPKERICKTIGRIGIEQFTPDNEFLNKYQPEDSDNDFLQFLGR
ncbi:nitrite reductase [Bacillota bacterium LX-D]|nr:nitrite reductase [Bacillota bacterium LX-D]